MPSDHKTPKPTPAEVIAHLAANNPVYQGLGMRLVHSEPGRSRFELVAPPSIANAFGQVHGGMLFAIADLALGFTCNSKENERSVTAGATIEFLSPGRIGERLVAEAFEVHRDARNGVYDVRITNEAGETVAVVRGRMRIVGGPVKPV